MQIDQQAILARFAKPSKLTSERQELLKLFLDRLNFQRIKDGYKPLSPAAVGVKLSHIPTSNLWAFYRKCETYDSFGAGFWNELRSTKI